MAYHEPGSSLVQGRDEFAERVGQTADRLLRELERVQRQNARLPERDTVSDQADGARGPEQALHSEPESGPVGEKTGETSRLSARRRTETRG